MTHKARIVEYLRRHGSITRMEAFRELGITELSRPILELEALGFRIRRYPTVVPTRVGESARVVKYVLRATPKDWREAV